MNSFFNWSYIDDTSSDIPDSVYTAKISSIKESESKSGNPMWEFILSLKELPSAKIRVFQVIGGNYSPDKVTMFKRNIARMAKRFSVPSGSNNINDWLGKCGFIRTFHKTADNGAVFINVKNFYTPEKGRAELFHAMQEKQAEAFFANSPSNPPDFNINNNSFSNNSSSSDNHDFSRDTQPDNSDADDWGF